MALSIPEFWILWIAFPNFSSEIVKKMIGGNVDQAHYKNACVIRISRALNYAGHPIPARGHTMKIQKGGAGRYYGLRVKDFRDYMKWKYGPPHITERLTGTVPDSMRGVKGILIFEGGLSGATGHVTLWDGETCIDDCYFGANKAYLWIEKGGKGSRITTSSAA